MANNQKLNATITIGGALAASFKNVISGATSSIGRVAQTILQLNERQKRLQTLAGHWEKQGRDASRFRTEIERVNRSLQQQQRIRANLTAQEQNQKQRGQLRGQLFDAVAIGAVLTAPIKTAANFQQAMANVQAVSRASGEELEQLTAKARELGATTNFSASEAADGMQYLAMAGFNVQQNMAAMPGLLNLAGAAQMDLGRTSDLASNILSNFGMKAEEMGYLGDVLTNTFTSSNTTMEMLGETMKYAGTYARQAGMSLEDTAAAAGKLGSEGMQASMAGTALRAIIQRLSSPVGEAAGLMDQLGVKVADADGNMRRIPDILADMQGAMKGFGDVAKLQITNTIFGVEAAGAATILMGSASTGALQSYSESLKQTGSAAENAKKRNATAMGAMRRLGSVVESLAITIGNVLLPVVTVGADALAGVIGTVDSLAQDFPLLTTVLVGGTAAMMSMKVATIAGGFAFTFIKGAWLKASLMGIRLTSILPMIATGIKTIGLALAANPIGLVITGIALAAGLLMANWEKVAPFFQAIWDSIVASATKAIDWLSKKFQWVGTALGKVKSWFGFGDSESSATTGKAGNNSLATDLAASDPALSLPAVDPTGSGQAPPLPTVDPARGNAVTVQKAGDSNTYNITISGSGDPEAVANRVMALLKAQETERNRGALFDQGGAYAY